MAILPTRLVLHAILLWLFLGFCTVFAAAGTTSAPAAPVINSAVAGNARVTLNWAAVNGATRYKVYQGTQTGGEAAKPVRIKITGTRVVVRGLTNGTTYFFKLAAVNAGGTSALSNEVSAMPVADYSISGTITANGAGLSDVRVAAGLKSATTGSRGAYTIPGLGNGAYTVTPSLAGHTFSPASQYVAVNDANVRGKDFTAGVPSSTVVIRVVGTNPSWGQEPIPGWPNASPVKDAPGYSLYDLEIGRNSNNVATYLTLYKFSGWQNGMPLDQFNPYRASSTLLSIPIEVQTQADGSTVHTGANSTQVLEALKSLVSLVLKREQPTRLVIAYSGHGSPDVFFEQAINNADAQLFLAFVRQETPGIPLILDFSTNCNVGYFDFAVRYYPYADYLIASEKPVGGFNPTDPGPVETWLANLHDSNLDKFWQSANTLDQAFDAIVAAREGLWYAGRNSIASVRVEQSLAVYTLGEFEALMRALKAHGLNPAVDLPKNSNDIATYVYATNNPALTEELEKFRIRYASDRNIINWIDNSQGFSVENLDSLQNYLANLR